MTKQQGLCAFAVVAVLILFAVISGCDLGDTVQVDVPRPIQASQDLPPKLSLNETEREFPRWQNEQIAVAEEWADHLAEARERKEWLSGLAMQAFTQYGPALGGVPVLGALFPALSAGIPYLLGRHKVASVKAEAAETLRREKEASFNAGMERGAAAAGVAA